MAGDATAGVTAGTAAAAVPLRPWSRGRSTGRGEGLMAPRQSQPPWSCPGRVILSGRSVVQPHCITPWSRFLQI